MNTRNLALSGVAALALALSAAQLSAQTTQQTTPSNAPAPQATSSMPGTSSQDGGLYGSQVNSPQYSSPAAVQETKQLNQQGVDGTTASPAVLNGEAPAAKATPSQSGYVGPNPSAPPQQTPQSSIAAAMQVAQADPQQQYQGQQQQYQTQQQQYQDQQQQYQDQKQRYDSNLRQYDQARWNYVDYPHVYAYEYDDSPRLQRLYLIAEPSQRFPLRSGQSRAVHRYAARCVLAAARRDGRSRTDVIASQITVFDSRPAVSPACSFMPQRLLPTQPARLRARCP